MRTCGVNRTTIDGIDVITVQRFAAEVGVDMTLRPNGSLSRARRLGQPEVVSYIQPRTR